jgi:hypothetical protein
MKKIFLINIIFLLSFFSQSYAISFEKNCKVPSGSIKKVKIENEKFNKFTLKDGQKGGCGSDRYSRHGAPYWERAEYAQRNTLSKNKSHKISFKIKILEGMVGERETFFQIHNYNNSFKDVYPSIMLKFDNNKLSKENWSSNKSLSVEEFLNGSPRLQIDYLENFKCIKTKGSYCQESIGGHKIERNLEFNPMDNYNKWLNFQIIISKIDNEKGILNVYLNEKHIYKDLTVHFPKRGTPRIKYGIYRPGNKNGNKTSSILYSKVDVNSY